jgi:N-acetylglutamate synthase/N-acetylornithine aminotransferase
MQVLPWAETKLSELCISRIGSDINAKVLKSALAVKKDNWGPLIEAAGYADSTFPTIAFP